MMNIEEFRLGWIVGIIEGEGWIGCKDGRPTISVSSVDKDVIDRLMEWAEVGLVRERSELTVKGKRVWIWSITKRDVAGEFLEKILPYLSERRSEKALHAIDEWKLAGPKRGQEETCIHGHELIGYNLVIEYAGDGKVRRRRCRQCTNDRARRYRSNVS